MGWEGKSFRGVTSFPLPLSSVRGFAMAHPSRYQARTRWLKPWHVFKDSVQIISSGRFLQFQCKLFCCSVEASHISLIAVPKALNQGGDSYPCLKEKKSLPGTAGSAWYFKGSSLSLWSATNCHCRSMQADDMPTAPGVFKSLSRLLLVASGFRAHCAEPLRPC